MPASTRGSALASTSPGVTARLSSGNSTLTLRDSPGASGTRAKPTRRCGGTTTLLLAWWTNTGTTSVPDRPPALVTVSVAVMVRCGPRDPATDRPSTLKVVY